jgi:hypothetical protein
LREKLDASLVAARRAEGKASPAPPADAVGGVPPPGKTAGLEALHPSDQMIAAVKDAEIRQ